MIGTVWEQKGPRGNKRDLNRWLVIGPTRVLFFDGSDRLLKLSVYRKVELLDTNYWARCEGMEWL